jgi:hypothetical protein
VIADGHRASLTEGREQGREVRRYLEALDTHRPRRGRKRTVESISNRLDVIDEELRTAEPLSRLHLLQERMNLAGELDTRTTGDLDELEAAFVAVANAYGTHKGVT